MISSQIKQENINKPAFVDDPVLLALAVLDIAAVDQHAVHLGAALPAMDHLVADLRVVHDWPVQLVLAYRVRARRHRQIVRHHLRRYRAEQRQQRQYAPATAVNNLAAGPGVMGVMIPLGLWTLAMVAASFHGLTHGHTYLDSLCGLFVCLLLTSNSYICALLTTYIWY